MENAQTEATATQPEHDWTEVTATKADNAQTKSTGNGKKKQQWKKLDLTTGQMEEAEPKKRYEKQGSE